MGATGLVKRLMCSLAVTAVMVTCRGEEEPGYDAINLTTEVYGTELLLLENSYRNQQSYRFEDFFWTGSGDGPTEDNPWTTEPPTTIYKTSTVTSTVFVKVSNAFGNETTTEKCVFNCESPVTPSGEIVPSPTVTEEVNLNGFGGGSDASQQFWIVTVLKSDGKNPIVTNLTNSLAKLYKIAFERQQARHLGINKRIKRSSPSENPVNVFIHKVDEHKLNHDHRIEVLYHVEVMGKPVDAVTASNDMNLISDDEIRSELGYPFVVKAEPYLKAGEPLGLAKAKNTWIFIGFSLVGLLVLLLVLAFVILGFTKRKKSQQPTSAGLDNRKHIFERGVGHENKGLVLDDEKPTYINFEDQHTSQAAVEARSRSSLSGTSTSSSSLDISPLMTLGKKHRIPPKKPPRPRAALNKTVPVNLPPEIFDSDSSSSGSGRKDSPETEYEPGILSPKSYLSMPSVKSFPRCNIPEPLTKVLEPVSMTHLDMPDDEPAKRHSPDVFARHGSVGTAQDPGVIGPVVWNMLKHGVSVDEGINDLKSSNISRMRKRFYNLLDDTFSLFGSRRETPAQTPVPGQRRVPIEVKSYSANENRDTNDGQLSERPRPKTTDARRPDPTLGRPRGAWSSTAPSPLVRPLSAGVVCPPRVNVEHVLAEGRFRPSDPAIPLIEAIKSEIERVSLPGSTTNLDKK